MLASRTLTQKSHAKTDVRPFSTIYSPAIIQFSSHRPNKSSKPRRHHPIRPHSSLRTTLRTRARRRRCQAFPHISKSYHTTTTTTTTPTIPQKKKTDLQDEEPALLLTAELPLSAPDPPPLPPESPLPLLPTGVPPLVARTELALAADDALIAEICEGLRLLMDVTIDDGALLAALADIPEPLLPPSPAAEDWACTVVRRKNKLMRLLLLSCIVEGLMFFFFTMPL